MQPSVTPALLPSAPTPRSTRFAARQAIAQVARVACHRLLASTTLALLCAVLPSVAHGAATKKQLLVKTRAGANESSFRALVASHGGRESSAIHAIGVRVVSLPAGAAERALAALQTSGLATFAEHDFPVQATASSPNDPYFTAGLQWHLEKIQAARGWDYSTGSPAVIIAIVDSGVDATHPDLAGKVLPGYDFIANDEDATDEFGHGTAVAGIAAAASNNGVGIAGVSWGAAILPVRVLDASGAGSYSNVINGIIFAADCGARIINLSLAGGSPSEALQAAIDYAWAKGALVVAAAGNTGSTAITYPAACRNVLAVSATDASDLRPAWSSYGNWLDLAAPGENIVVLRLDGSYTTASGTSFSAPIVSGVVSLMASANPSLSNVALSDLLLTSTDDVGAPGYDSASGYGRVNAARATAAAANFRAPDLVAPLATFIAPDDGASIQGLSTVNGVATDNVAVVRMELRVDVEVIATTDSASVSCVIDSRTLPDGEHTLLLIAYDAAGNAGTCTRQVRVTNFVPPPDLTPPTVTLSRLNGGTSAGNVKVRATATDNAGVTRIDFLVNGTVVAVSTAAVAEFEWKGAKAPKGTYQLQALARDAAGNAGLSGTITVHR